MRRLLLVTVLALTGCVGPSGWDARTDGGRHDPGPRDLWKAGQPGVEDLRSGSQNAVGIWLGGRPR